MKLQADTFGTAITSYGPDWVQVGAHRLTESFIINSETGISRWPCKRYQDLDAALFAPLAEAAPELVLFGSGKTLRFPHPEHLQALMQARIGIDTMDTPAACRTYNILAGEGRHVIAAILIETA